MNGSPDKGKLSTLWECNYMSEIVLQFEEKVWDILKNADGCTVAIILFYDPTWNG